MTTSIGLAAAVFVTYRVETNVARRLRTYARFDAAAAVVFAVVAVSAFFDGDALPTMVSSASAGGAGVAGWMIFRASQEMHAFEQWRAKQTGGLTEEENP
jgi:hypothetical protein